jgi:hypothetical protein
MGVTLTVALTDDELSLYESKRKADNEALPTYYDAVTGSYKEISRDFEAFLILTDSATRGAISSWLQTTGDRINSNIERDELRASMLDLEIDDSVTESVTYNRDLVLFNQFRSDITAGKFATVGEVQSLISDVQLGIEETTRKNDRAQHRLATVSRMKQFFTPKVGTSSQRIQAESWIGLLLNY